MFEDLTRRISLQNLQKIKKIHTNLRYSMQQQNQSPIQHHAKQRNSDDESLDDLQVEMEEREQNFRKINELENEESFLKKDSSIPPNMHRKLQNEIELLKQRMEIERNTHRRQFQYQAQIYKRREQWMKVENSKLKFLVKKHKAEESQIKQLKKDMVRLEEIKESLQSKIDGLLAENRELKMIIDRLQQEKKNRVEKQAKQILKQGDEVQKITKMAISIKRLQQDLQYEKKSGEEKKKYINKLNDQIQKTKQKLSKKQNQLYEKDKALIRRQQQLNNELIALKRRNQYLQETFIEKMSEITRLQAQTTNSLIQQSMSANIKQSRQMPESSLNLHEESPIKPVPQQNNLSERKPKVVSDNSHNPQQTQKIKNKKYTQFRDCQCKCGQKIAKYQLKLEEANKQIMALLSEKIGCIRKSSSNSKNLTLTEKMGFDRGRIMSWKQKP